MADQTPSTGTYAELLASIKTRIQQAQVRAALVVNQELILLYWGIGKDILAKQEMEGWGKGVIPKLAKDLASQFPAMKGLSPRNLGYMKAFADAWPDESILQQAAAKLPWFHNCLILDKIKDQTERAWYTSATIEHGWSRAVLAMQIESGLYQRKGKTPTNFERTLPPPQFDLAQQILKDPYNFDFLTLSEQAHERDLEQGLLAHLRQFLVELGVGFAFVGSQVPLEVGGEDFKIDLLFYHLNLRCFVVIDLKMTPFKPEYAGKMNFYLSAVDDLMRHPDDKPSIGLILCKTKNEVVAEYAVRDVSKPLGIAEFTHLVKLPEEFKGTLPSIEEIEAELGASETEE